VRTRPHRDHPSPSLPTHDRRSPRKLTPTPQTDDYSALEPAISGQIMELHHSKHHNTYVNSFNDATEKMSAAQASSDIAAQIALQPLINFHGGGHLNHALFWENLAPRNQGGGEPPAGKLGKAIEESYGGLEGFKGKFNAALAGVQGSGWAWLVKDNQTGGVAIRTYAVSLGLFERAGGGMGRVGMLMGLVCNRIRIRWLGSSRLCLGSMLGSMRTSMFD